MKWIWRLLSLKCWHFEASEDIITKFKSQGLHIKRIKYWKASGSGNPPSLIPALRNIGILHHKKAELRILLQHSVHNSLKYNFVIDWFLCVFFIINVFKYCPLGYMEGGYYLFERPSTFIRVPVLFEGWSYMRKYGSNFFAHLGMISLD